MPNTARPLLFLHGWAQMVLLWIVLGVAAAPCAQAQEAALPRHQVDIRGEWFYVDGERFVVKGVGYSPWRPGQLPWQERVSPALMEADFQRITAAGFNTIRTWSPLTTKELALADRYGLMVIQGIWLDQQPKDYSSTSYQAMVQAQVRQRVQQFRGADNILLVLVGNELPVGQVYLSGKAATETFLRGLRDAVKAADPTRFVSIANWPELAFLDSGIWDAVCFNAYPYAPDSIAYSFGYTAYLRHLKALHDGHKPFLVTEFGLSVSPTGRGAAGYGGNTPEAQARGLVTMAEEIAAAGAQGGCVFEWNDEWWKNYEHAGDEHHHDDDPEEWFGLIAIDAREAPLGAPRPAYAAMRDYNQAIVVSPREDTLLRGPAAVEVYAEPDIVQVRYRAVRGRKRGAWRPLAHASPHWWTGTWETARGVRDGDWTIEVEALDAQGQVAAHRQRACLVANRRNPSPPYTVRINTEQDQYTATNRLIQATFDVQVTDARGRPAAGVPVRYAIAEPLVQTFITDTRATNPAGHMTVIYNLRDPGIIGCSAGVAWADKQGRERRFGEERFVFVERPAAPSGPAVGVPAQGPPVSAAAAAPPAVPAPAPAPTEPPASPTAPAPLAPGPVSVAPPVMDPPADIGGTFTLYDPGTEFPIHYEHYGTFLGVGTKDYRYAITDFRGLAKAAGEGIYPNDESIYLDPAYRQMLRAKRLEGDHWDYVNIDDYQASFYRWVTADEDPGVKLYYAAYALERAGLIQQAIKAYYAVVVHYPNAVGWTYWHTPWYVGKVALDNVLFLLRTHPAIDWRLVGAKVVVENGYDNDIKNDAFLVTPGRWLRRTDPAAAEAVVDVSRLPVTRRSGQGRVQVVQFANGHWQLQVAGRPFVVRGITYESTAVGQSPDDGSLEDWMRSDHNGNGRPDGPYDTWVDANGNNQQDPDEPVVGDFALIQQMGADVIRTYHHGAGRTQVNTQLLRDLYERYGIMTMMGDFVGMYTVGSGASWEHGTDYTDLQQIANMRQSVQQMVREFKDEPWLLMWVLGNENNYGGAGGFIGGMGNAAQHPDVFYGFINELARWIHEADPDHPVALGNGDVLFLDRIAKDCPDVDIFGLNAYRGVHGFGFSLWQGVQDALDKPVLITEYGCPAYHRGRPEAMAGEEQARYHEGAWRDIAANLAGRGVGNAIGGVVFEWNDEWWKAGQPPRFSSTVHETTAAWAGPFPGGYSHEEWYGITGQGDGSRSPFLRQLRPTYFLYQRLWRGKKDE